MLSELGPTWAYLPKEYSLEALADILEREALEHGHELEHVSCLRKQVMRPSRQAKGLREAQWGQELCTERL